MIKVNVQKSNKMITTKVVINGALLQKAFYDSMVEGKQLRGYVL